MKLIVNLTPDQADVLQWMVQELNALRASNRQVPLIAADPPQPLSVDEAFQVFLGQFMLEPARQQRADVMQARRAKALARLDAAALAAIDAQLGLTGA